MLQVARDKEYYLEKYLLGLEDYKKNLFDLDKPLHFHNLHNSSSGRSIIGTELRDCANAIIVLTKNKLSFANDVLDWTLQNFYNDGKVYFYLNRFWKSKIDFMRWNSWLLLSLVVYKRYKELEKFI